jgi:dolichyl-phosphate beta-glucosyltransferase
VSPLTRYQGVSHSRGRFILFADADGASRFADLDLLLESMERTVDDEGQGMVVGSRAHLVSSEAVVKVSRVGSTAMCSVRVLVVIHQTMRLSSMTWRLSCLA